MNIIAIAESYFFRTLLEQREPNYTSDTPQLSVYIGEDGAFAFGDRCRRVDESAVNGDFHVAVTLQVESKNFGEFLDGAFWLKGLKIMVQLRDGYLHTGMSVRRWWLIADTACSDVGFQEGDGIGAEAVRGPIGRFSVANPTKGKDLEAPAPLRAVQRTNRF